MTINEGISIFLSDQLLKGNSPRTIKNYSIILYKFSEFISNKDIGLISIDDLNSYHVYLHGTNINSVSLRTYLTHVRVFVHYLFDEKYIDENIVNKMRMPKTSKKLVNILTDAEALLILGFFDNSTFLGCRNKVVILLMLDCGLRKGEVESLKLSFINFDKNYLFVNGKGNKERIVPFGSSTKKALLQYLEMRNLSLMSSDYFLLKYSGEPFGKETIKNIFRDLKSETGIKRLHAHLLRHTFATNFLINSLGDIYELSRILGHSELQTTQIYVNIANNYIMMEKKSKRTYIDILTGSGE